MSDSLLAVGSQSHITLVDPRKKTPVQDIESLDDAHGAAPLHFKYLLSFACGESVLMTDPFPAMRGVKNWALCLLCLCCMPSSAVRGENLA